MNFDQCVIEAIEKAPNEVTKERLRQILEECREKDEDAGRVSTMDSGGHGGTLPPKPPKPPKVND